MLVCGRQPRIGQSALSQRLAELMNLPSVLQTDLMFELVQHIIGGDISRVDGVASLSMDGREYDGFQRECALIRQGTKNRNPI